MRLTEDGLTKIRVINGEWYDGYRLAILVIDGKKRYATKFIMEEVPQGTYEIDKYSITLTQEEAQLLTNDLWQCGVRPSSGEGSVGQLEATEKHLNDMRRIVEKKLDVKLMKEEVTKV